MLPWNSLVYTARAYTRSQSSEDYHHACALLAPPPPSPCACVRWLRPARCLHLRPSSAPPRPAPPLHLRPTGLGPPAG